MTSRYLLRLDDACPTMDAVKWRRLEQLLDELMIKPLVAVVPDNRDPDLDRCPPDPDFWRTVRRWRDKGWTIAMHGYQHLLQPTSARLVLPFYQHSEFAGLTFHEQAKKLSAAWSVFGSHGLQPNVWIAPAHCFDRVTLSALAAETPIRVISDGIARQPYLEDGFQWLPQQLWRLTPRKSGLWTVCLHPNTMVDADLENLRKELLGAYRGRITEVSKITPPIRGKSLSDRVESALFWQRHRLQKVKQRAKILLRG
jgi:predicted deacetylase